MLPADERYEVLSTLGHGGMGTVYEVRDRELDEVIALKVLRPELGGAGAVERFKQEIKIARRLSHPNIARLYDLFIWRGQLAIAQELIPGEDLDEIVDQAGALPLDRIVRYLRYVTSALQAAHDMGVVHRDLKSSNIRIDRDDRPRLMDFGLAALAGEVPDEERAAVLGTPTHISPEQLRSPDSVDHRSDLYSLGVVLFRMATGTLPFAATDTSTLVHAHLNRTPPAPRQVRPDLPPFVEDAILRCLEKDPAKRYRSAAALYDDLQEALEDSEVETHPLRTGLRPGRVLVVDAVDDARRQVVEALTDLGAEVVEAVDGYGGVETAMSASIDFVLLSLRLPVLDGQEALRILKSTAQTASIPVVMMTAGDDPEEGLLARETGADMFLSKPLKPDVLELLLDKYVT